MVSNSSVCFQREMGFSEAEFFRVLPAALAGRPFSRKGSCIDVEVDGGSWQIEVGAQQYRKIASIQLPYLEVKFHFDGLVQDSITEIMRYFDLRYQRGGG